jgi:hypothetical protein
MGSLSFRSRVRLGTITGALVLVAACQCGFHPVTECDQTDCDSFADAGFSGGVGAVGGGAGSELGGGAGGATGSGGSGRGGAPDLLDPAEIYLAGSLSPGPCRMDALAHWSTPNTASAGFDCNFDKQSATIRPSDGRLLYLNALEGKVREYHCDSCNYARGSQYPSSVLLNDTVVTTSCPSPGDRVSAFHISAEGTVLHECLSSWRKLWNSSGAVVYDGSVDPLVALGGSGWALTESRVVQLTSGTGTVFTGLPDARASGSTWSAVRWNSPDGFYVAVSHSGGGAELWRVSTTGVGTKMGDYPAPPQDASLVFGARLDAAGRLFQFARDRTNSATGLIVRREIGKSSEVVYTEATNPLVRISISSLVTGP